MINAKQESKEWEKSAKEDLAVAKILVKSRKYSQSLFFCHLTLEKLIKGLIILKTKKSPPYIHDLVRLCHLAKIDLKNDQIKDLNTISTFSIAGRYSDYKFKLHLKATPDFTKESLKLTIKYFRWLEKSYQ